MERLRKARTFVTAVAVPLSYYAGSKGQEMLVKWNLPALVEALLVLLLVLTIFFGVRQLAMWLLALRRVRRWILRGQFIEGTWMDVVRRKGEVVNVGVLNFDIRGDVLHVWGNNFRTDGTVQNAFNSEMTKLTWPKLLFYFESDQQTTGSPTSEGTAQLRFAPVESGLPQRYSGFCRNFNGQRGDCSGWRVADEATLMALKNPAETKKIVLDVIRSESGTSAGNQQSKTT